MFTQVLVAIVIVLLIAWLRYRSFRFQTFKKLGIKGPEPSMLFGNLRELANTGLLESFNTWYDKYGKIFGYYRGGIPVLMISDPEVLRHIQVKEFHHASDRPKFPIPSTRNEFRSMLTAQSGERWKHVRGVLSPTFSAAKLKRMTSAMNIAVEKLMGKLASKAEAGEVCEMYKLYQAMTLEVIGKCAFGLDVDPQNNPDDDFLVASRNTLSVSPTRNPFILAAFVFPEFRYAIALVRNYIFLLRDYFEKRKKAALWLMDRLTQVIALRREKNIVGNDMVQLMLDASENKDSEFGQVVGQGKAKSLLTDDEIKGNAFVFLIAGYETTSTALAFTTHLLATNPNVQDILIEEIDERLSGMKGDITYEMVHDLPYLDAVLSEALRLYPPAGVFVNRVTSSPITVGSFTIPANMEVQVPVWPLHHDPEHWDDPDTFNPSRFLSKNKPSPYVYQPFGIGPRNCIGMRFAQMEAKIALARILSKFQFKVCEKTQIPLKVAVKTATISPEDEVTVKMVLRK